MLVYSAIPPIVAPIRFQPKMCSAISWSRNTMLKTRFAKKIGEKVRRLPITKRRKPSLICSRLPNGITNVISVETSSRTKTSHSQCLFLITDAVQFAASTRRSTARKTSELLTQVVPKSRLNLMTLLVSRRRNAIPMKAKASLIGSIPLPPYSSFRRVVRWAGRRNSATRQGWSKGNGGAMPP